MGSSPLVRLFYFEFYLWKSVFEALFLQIYNICALFIITLTHLFPHIDFYIHYLAYLYFFSPAAGLSPSASQFFSEFVA